MAKILVLMVIAVGCSGCESGLPKEFQPADVRAVVKACHQNGGTWSHTVFNKTDNYIRVVCSLPLSRQGIR